MPVEMIVCATQVLDPETPASAFRIDSEARRAVAPPNIPPVLNGFDENAVEAALRIKDEVGGNVTVLSLGDRFAMDVMKKPLSMGADELVLVQDDALADLDAYATAYALSEAIKRIGQYDLVLCGRQASDWDGAQVPQGVAEMLDLPCVTVAKRVDVVGSGLVVQRALPDGYEVVEAEHHGGGKKDADGLERRRPGVGDLEAAAQGPSDRSVRAGKREAMRIHRGGRRGRRRTPAGHQAA